MHSEELRRVHNIDIQMRFADTDALGHVNNASFVLYAETARLSFLGVLGTNVRSLILAHLAIDFRKQVRFGEAISVATRVEKIGTTSVTLLQTVIVRETVAADIRSVVVSYDYEGQRATPWSAESRALLEEYSGESDHQH